MIIYRGTLRLVLALRQASVPCRVLLLFALFLVLFRCYVFLNFVIEFPLEVRVYLQVIVLKYLSLACHTKVFKSEVSLLVYVAVVIL